MIMEIRQGGGSGRGQGGAEGQSGGAAPGWGCRDASILQQERSNVESGPEEPSSSLSREGGPGGTRATNQAVDAVGSFSRATLRPPTRTAGGSRSGGCDRVDQGDRPLRSQP